MQLNWATFDNVNGFSPTTMAISLATLLVAVAYYSLKSSGLPPGPTGVPFFGSWPFMDPKHCHLQFHDWKKKYGDIFSINVTGTLYINLGTTKAIREAHISRSNCFTQRTEEFTLLASMFTGGVFLRNGEDWKANRKFFMQSIKERLFVAVKDLMSGSLYDSMKSTVDELRFKRGETVNIVEFLTNKCNDIMRLTLFGQTGISKDRILEINECYSVMLACFTPKNSLVIGNVAKYFILPLTKGYKESISNEKVAEKILYQIIDEHKSTYDEENIRDIIDDYIKERNLRRSKEDPTAQYFTDKELMASLIQIIGDANLSVAAFVAFFIKSLIDNPEEQEKIYRELLEVVGLDRNPTIEDKSKLTYTNAFIMEVLRTSVFLPFFASMECTKETTLRGYRIPKGAITLTNTYSAHLDPEAYPEPHKFDPTRYIVQEGKRKTEPPVTFGVGKRACIGESFAMMQAFLFITTLIKNFRIILPDGVNDSAADLLAEGKLTIVVQPRN